MTELEQFTAEVLERLADAPWLLPFVEDDDVDLDAAEARYKAAVRAARKRLSQRGVTVYERIQPRPGIQTTALLVDVAEEQL